MEFRREQLKVYAITDRSWLGEQTLAQAVESALAGGADDAYNSVRNT